MIDVALELVRPGWEWLDEEFQREEIRRFGKRIELAGRTCYKSEDKITPDSSKAFVKKILGLGHESVIEHNGISVRIIGDRSMSHQLVRHRIASYSQESQRFCNYGKKDFLKVVLPPSIAGVDMDVLSKAGKFIIPTQTEGGEDVFVLAQDIQDDGMIIGNFALEPGSPFWVWSMVTLTAYRGYKDLLKMKVRPEDARSVLPNATKTEIVTTFNLRQWRWFFKKRCAPDAQWQIRDIAKSLLAEFYELCPEVFADQYEKYIGEV